MSHPHLVSYIGRDDVDLVLGRLPSDLRAPLRGVQLTSTNFLLRPPGLKLSDVRWPPLEDAQTRFLRRVLGGPHR